jgi:hypothetical protein
VSNFGSYNAVYGTVGGVIVLLLWLYLTAFVLLLGAEVNALAKRLAEGGRQSLPRAASVSLGALPEVYEGGRLVSAPRFERRGMPSFADRALRAWITLAAVRRASARESGQGQPGQA